MRKIAALACLLGLLGAIPAQASEVQDVFGRRIPIGQGRPTVVLYANRGTRDELRQHVYEFIYDVRDEKPIVVVHVDLRDVPGLFKGMAKGEIRKSHRESLDLMRGVFRQHGEAPPPELETSLFMVADSKGEPHKSLGLEKGFGQVLARVLAPNGQELARGPFPQSARRFVRAMASGPRRVPPATVAGMGR